MTRSEIVNKLKSIAGVNEDQELAKILDVDKRNIAQFKAQKTINLPLRMLIFVLNKLDEKSPK